MSKSEVTEAGRAGGGEARSLRVSAALCLGVSLSLWSVMGCHTCEDHDKSAMAVVNAKGAYDGGKFDLAKQVYMRALEYCPQNYDALIGFANAAREYGTQLYARADATARQGKIEAARKEVEEANQNHQSSDQAFRSALLLEEDDLAPHYGLGLLYYQRATTPANFPYPLDDRVNRRDARDRAIKEFKTVVAKHSNLLQVRRYLGLALFAAGVFDEGRDHLRAYHDRMQANYTEWMTFRPGSDAEKELKRIELTKIELDIAAVRDVFGTYRDELDREVKELEGKPARTPVEEERLKTAAKDRLAVDLMIRTYQLTNLNAVETEVRERSSDYVQLFNLGKMESLQAMLLPPAGGEGAFYQAIQRKLDEGTRYRNVNFRTVIVSGDSASVGLICEIVTSKGRPRPDSEITLRWRRSGGVWRVVEHP